MHPSRPAEASGLTRFNIRDLNSCRVRYVGHRKTQERQLSTRATGKNWLERPPPPPSHFGRLSTAVRQYTHTGWQAQTELGLLMLLHFRMEIKCQVLGVMFRLKLYTTRVPCEAGEEHEKLMVVLIETVQIRLRMETQFECRCAQSTRSEVLKRRARYFRKCPSTRPLLDELRWRLRH